MGLINITNLENDVPATANLFNERFGAIVGEINGNLDATNIKDGSITSAKLAADVLDRVYPVGSVYVNATNAANPASLLGFGTWEAFGAGRVPVGFDGAQEEFNAPGKTGGEKQVALTEAQMPSHSHHVNDPGHSHGMAGDTVYTSATGSSRTTSSGGGQQLRWSVGGTTGAGTGIWLNNAGGNAAHNNLQPYITVYMWRRTV